jgi:hypothetical protein
MFSAMDTLGFAEVVRRLAIDDPDGHLCASDWASGQLLRPDGAISFLQVEHIVERRRFAGLPASVDAVLLQAADLVRQSAELSSLAWHFQYLLYDLPEFPAHRHAKFWPQPLAQLGSLSGAFYLLIALEAIPRMLAAHAARGVSLEISRGCCSHYSASLQRYQQNHDGVAGISAGPLYWLQNHVQRNLFRLGRLEFMIKPFKGPLVAWRNRSTQAVVALTHDGVAFDEEGIIVDDEENATWTSRLLESETSVTGTPISPQGYAQRESVTLAKAEWQRVLTEEDSILEVHIPAGGGMTPHACQASMQQALEFFPRYFPEHSYVGFACGSWILNPQLQQIYRADSNMVLWQRELYLFPLANRPDSRSGLFFVFGTPDEVDLATLPRDTSLRKALVEHLDGGGRLISSGMFLLLEDFKHFGTQVYRREH